MIDPAVGRTIALGIGGLFLGLGAAKLWWSYKKRKQKGGKK